MQWIILPFSEPKFAEWSLQNLKRQACAFNVVVVENGDGIDAWPEKSGVLLRSEPGKNAAMNEALRLLRTLDPTGVWRAFDQDDWYGRYAAAKTFQILQTADVACSLQRWIYGENGHLYHFNPGHDDSIATLSHVPKVWGGSVGARVEVDHPWESKPPADSQGWVRQAIEHGRYVQTYVADECWRRWDNSNHHVWRSDPKCVQLRLMGMGGLDYGRMPFADAINLIRQPYTGKPKQINVSADEALALADTIAPRN